MSSQASSQSGDAGPWTAKAEDTSTASGTQRFRDRWTEAGGSLTTRARAFVAGGLTAVLCGLLLGERDLVQIGLLVVLLPVLTVLAASRNRQRLSLLRTLSSPTLAVGQVGSVCLEIRNLGSRSGLLQLEEHVPWTLGQRTRFVISRLAPGEARQVRYPVTAEVRGQHQLGPLVVRVTDPFGMLATYRSFPRTSTITVVPPIEPLTSRGHSGSLSGAGDLAPHPFTRGNSPDSTVREYRTGDDLRRVHWPTTARTGEMMVRHEEEAWQSSCTVLVDNRSRSHRGQGQDSSLERGISAAASVAVHLAGLGYRIRLVSAEGRELVHPEGSSSTTGNSEPHRRILEFLATLPSTDAVSLPAPHLITPEPGAFVVAVLGELEEPDRSLLRQVRRSGGTSWAIALDVGTWAGRSMEVRPASGDLRSAGWKTVDLARGASLPNAWRELLR